MTIRKTITLTDKQDDWIKAQIAGGDYTNDSEYFRDLIRRDQEQKGKLRGAKERHSGRSGQRRQRSHCRRNLGCGRSTPHSAQCLDLG